MKRIPGSTHVRRIVVWIAAPVLLYLFTPACFGWVGLYLGLLLLGTGIARRKTGRGALLFNAGVIVLAFGCAELYLWATDPPSRYTIKGSREVANEGHPELGYAPKPGSRQHIECLIDGERVYEVDYTIAADGCRLAPPRSEAATSSVLCFGGSCMFGEGLKDEQAVPYVVGTGLGPGTRVYNLAFRGWGPHQMLRALEIGTVAAVAAEPATHAIFWTIPGHVGRVAGDRFWDRRGPRYGLKSDGSVELRGSFADLPSHSWLARHKRKFLARSYIYRAISAHAAGRSMNPADIPLYAAVVAAARDRVSATWPGCEFHVLFSDAQGEFSEQVVQALEDGGLTVHRLSAVLPGYREDPTRWNLHEIDDHPNAEAAAAVARYVLEEIVRTE